MATGLIEPHLRHSFNWENGAPGLWKDCGGCSYSFVNWEMLPARLNRGMLTPGHSAGGLQSVRCASARRRKAPCPA